MSLVFTNQVASQALRGQAVKVTLSKEAQVYLSQVTKGQAVTTSGSTDKGTVYRVDYKGLSFLVRPTTDNSTFSSTGGLLAAGATITVG
jgi:hypothetical protein